MEMDKLVGREFVIKDTPVIYVIEDVTLTDIKVRSRDNDALMTLPTYAFHNAYKMGQLVFIGEPLTDIKVQESKPIEEPTSEEEPTNFFSFDDL